MFSAPGGQGNASGYAASQQATMKARIANQRWYYAGLRAIAALYRAGSSAASKAVGVW